MIPEYKNLKSLVLNAIAQKNLVTRDIDTANVIGKYYCDFLKSEKKCLSIYVPFYNEQIASFLSKYIYYLDLSLKLFSIPPLTDPKGTYILDLFRWSLSSHLDISDFFVPFSGIGDGFFNYGLKDEFQLPFNRLAPVFNGEDISKVSSDHHRKFIDILNLASLMASEDQVKHPICFDLNKEISLFLSKSHYKHKYSSSSIFINSNEIKSTEELRTLVSQLKEKKGIDKVIIIRYPYNVDIDSRLHTNLSSIKKKFEICFKSRYYHENEIDTNELYFLPEEFSTKSDKISVDLNIKYDVINTIHSSELFEKLRNLKSEWNSFEHNRYKYPNPLRWLLYVNISEDIEFWKKQFLDDYQIITGSLKEDIYLIIDQISEINWIDKYFSTKRDILIFLPTSRRHGTLIEGLRKHLSQRFSIIEDISELRSESNRLNISEIILLDPFNIIELANMKTLGVEFNLVVPIPDFIYYNLQPFLQYFLAKYYYDPLVSGARNWLDPNYESLSKDIGIFKNELLGKCRKDLIAYLQRFNHTTDEPEPNDQEIEFVRSEDEIQEGTVKLIEKKENATDNEKWIIQTEEGPKFVLYPNSKVLIYRHGFSVSTKAIILEKGMNFIPYNELNSTYDKELISSKLSKMPNMARSWQTILYRFKETGQYVYRQLKDRGLSITREDYFNYAYLLNKDDVDDDNLPTNMPRSLYDWSIICRFIGINKQDENLAWISYYGRKDVNRLKKAYAEVISYLYDNSLIGEVNNPKLIHEVSNIIIAKSGIDSSVDIDFMQIAKSIISFINENIDFYTVLDINKIIE